nr:hypothetical protein CFP56_21077 [Quercus suber]
MAKRKHASDEDQPGSKQRQLHDITSFAKIGKSVTNVDAMKRRKTSHARESTGLVCASVPSTEAKKRKRKLVTVSEDESDEDTITVQTSRPQPVTSTPRTKRVKNALLLSPTQTPSKSAAALFDRLRLDRPINAITFTTGKQQDAYDTPPRTPEVGSEPSAAELPSELQDLIQIHVVFLTALSLHFAQNGVSAGVNVAELLPNMTMAWKKRAVNLDDLHRVLSVVPESGDGFFLEDCGRAGIRVVRRPARGRSPKRAANFLDHDELNASFEDALQVRWTTWQANAAPSPQHSAAAFLTHLPLTEIMPNTSAANAAPLLARGQPHLAAIKAAQTAAQAEAAAASACAPLTAAQKTSDAVLARGTTLLDRIRTKQALAADAPAGPTREQLARRAALQRLEDIARVLDVLLGAKGRASFSMQVMVQNLQQSLRHPISREDAERCLDLLASEVTPGFVNVVQSGTVKAVVLSKARKVALEVVRDRVKSACAAL